MKQTETITVTVTPALKNKIKKALDCTGYASVSEFVRESMSEVSDIILSVGMEEEEEIILVTRPRSDGFKTEKLEHNIGVKGELF